MKITATARRTGDWWAVEVPEVPGAFTQVRRLDQVEDAAASAVADLLEVDAATIEVTVEPLLDSELRVFITYAREASEEAAKAQAEASACMRTTVARLRKVEGLTTRDTAVLLGVSQQRVAQLTS